ncbi:MAG: PAS domain-containing protein [Spirochaetes bacterium]|nr:PAS domain-containing protein [Spirochaetota bacterium]MBU1081498.1 PAS domain-containing protein [Spirochaetota bacterium]
MGASKNRTILLVEDEAVIAMAEARQLESEGYRVVHCPSGEAAIDLVCSSREPVDLILMDIDLGRGMDGTQAAREILSRLDIPVLFLSSHTEKAVVEKSEAITNYGYVVKNSSLTVLDASIKMAFKLFEANRRSLAHLRMLEDAQEAARIGFWSLTLPDMGHEWTKGLMTIFGLPLGAPTPTLEQFWSFVHPADKPFVERQVQIQMDPATDPITKYEYRIVLRDGETRYLEHVGRKARDPEGRLVRLYGSIQDITERKRAQEALREKDRLLSLFIQQSPVYSFIKSVSPGESRVLYASENYVDMIGVPGSEMVGKTMAELFPADLAAKFTEDDWRAVENGETLELDEELNGRNYLTLKFPIRIGEKFLLAGYTIDITDRRRADLRVRELLKEKDTILKEAHHRTANNMYTMSSLLRLRSAASASRETKSILDDACATIESMRVLYDKLYRSERQGEVSLRGYLVSLIAEIVGVFPCAAEVSTDLDIEDVAVDVKPMSTLGIILNELITNSMKYAFAGRGSGTIRVRASVADRVLRLEYRDDGPGLPESVYSGSASGFGMQLIRMLVDQLDGSLRIGSGRGAAFSIEARV